MTDLKTLDGAPTSAICFGAMQFGGAADRQAAGEMYAASRDAGINFFDTAYAYTKGESEQFLGALIAQERKSVYVATKADYARGSSRATIKSSLDESLDRLQLDQVDALYLHRWDENTPLEESFEALAEAQQSGLIRHIGVSNFAAWQVMKANAVALSFGTRIDLLQPMYNLVKRQVEVEILPMARDQNIAVASYSPLGGGLLTGKYARGETGRLTTNDQYAARYAPDWMRDAAVALSGIADEVGVAPATLAVAWVARNPDIAAPIISARSLDQLHPSLAAVGFHMDDALYARISALSPAPPPATDRLEEA